MAAQKETATGQYPLATVPNDQLPKHIQELLAELPDCVVLQSNVEAFQEAVNAAWAQHNREVIPACIVRPPDTPQLSKAIAILKREYDARSQAESSDSGLFAVRSGGCNPGLGSATVQDGVVIDLSLFREVTPAADGATVTLGTGSKWLEVYKKLDEKGITVMGGRNVPVGVGGLTLQGKISMVPLRDWFPMEMINADSPSPKAGFPSILPDMALFATMP